VLYREPKLLKPPDAGAFVKIGRGISVLYREPKLLKPAPDQTKNPYTSDFSALP
jgi:hypothetical protein